MADESDVLVDELSAEALLEAARCAIDRGRSAVTPAQG